MIEDPKIRRELAKQGRLWLLAIVCATAGAITIDQTGSLITGVTVFLLCVVPLGTLLVVYEKRRGRTP